MLPVQGGDPTWDSGGKEQLFLSRLPEGAAGVEGGWEEEG